MIRPILLITQPKSVSYRTELQTNDVVRDETRDALGRLTQVTEDPGAGNLAYGTAYTYDAMDNLLTVTQGVQTRTFVYSSLSRLRSATNPESGTTHYCYADAGNLTSWTDARVVLPPSAYAAGHLICPARAAHATATYVYDDLQRLDTVTYSDTTPNVDYDYHMSGSPNIGQLKSIFSDAAKAIYNSYDTLGRVTSMSQTIAGHSDTFTFGNKYYLNDALKSQTYPSGRTVTYTLDDAGRVKTVSDGTTTYADMPASAGHAYAPDGRLQQMKLGNNLWETRDYHTPGTTTLLKLVTSDEMTMLPGATERVALGYHYSGTANNGNLMTHTIARPGRTQPWTQTFTYDAANRLQTARETGGYDREFGYDRYGNRWVKPHPVKPNNGMTQTDMHEPKYATQFDAAKNQLASPPMVDYYDAAGNQTMYSPYTLAYDAENRLKSMTHASSGSGTYLYDGQGRRVKKTWTPGGGTAQDTYYVYDIAGRLAAEYGTGTAPASGTVYPFTDLLGSVRAVTDANGAVIECYDYLPFGRMLSSSDNERSTSCHPADPDSSLDSKTSQKFTGQVRDGESRLDYFKARYMSAPQGRFLSPDQPLFDQDEYSPQSWNLYAYVRNNPLRYADPSGYKCIELDDGSFADDGTGGGCEEAGVDADGNIEPHRITVTAPRGNVIYSLILNTFFAADAAAQAYFDPLVAAIGVRPSHMEPIPTSTDYTGVAARGGAFVGSIFLGPGGRAGRAIRILERGLAGTTHIEVKTARGVYEVLANVRRNGGTIILDKAHIQGSGAGQFGPGMIRELREAARQFGRESGATRVIVNPAIRSSGANPGRAMRSFEVEVR